MNKVVFVGFKDETQAYEGARALRNLHKQGNITLFADAIVAKDKTGKVHVRDAGAPPVGTLGGLLTGSLVGLLGGPVGVAVGAGAGTLVGAAFDVVRAGIGRDFVDDVGAHLVPGASAVIAEIDEDWLTPLDTRMAAIGGTVFRRTHKQIDDAYFEREIEAQQAELVNLEAERVAGLKTEGTKESAERAARLQEKIDAVRRKVQEQERGLAARVRAVKAEGDEKVALLRAQMALADEEAKARLEKRIADVRSDYRHRAVNLSNVLERRKTPELVQ